MKIIGIILLYILGLYILKRVFYILRVKIKKNSKQVELIINFFEDKQVKSNVATAFLPFYDEKMYSYFGFGPRGLHIGYTPYETMLEVLKKVFADKYLIQICLDDLFYPSLATLKEYYRPKNIVDKMQTAFKEKDIELIDGAVLYNSNAIKNGALENGISDGNDLFYICSQQLDENKKNVYKTQIEEWQKGNRLEVYFKEKEFLGAEGELFKCFEGWRLVHRHNSFLLYFINEIFKMSVEKLFRINGLSIPENFLIPSIDMAFKDILTFSEKPNRIKMYFEDDNFIIFRERDKAYETYITKMPVIRKKEEFKEVLSYFVPTIIDRKAYSKKKLRKFGIKFLFLFIYMALLTIGLGPLVFNVWHVENIVLMAICFFAAPLLGVVSLILSIYYLSLGIFGKKEFVRAGI